MVEERAQPGRFTSKIATIAAGQSLSASIDASQGAPCLIYVPQGWTAAPITFQVSPNGSTFYDLLDGYGHEIVVQVEGGTACRIGGWQAVMFFKVRSGPRDAPVPQEAERIIEVTVDLQAY